MTTLTETMVELADCHTSLYYLGANPAQPAPLPLGNAADYEGLYKTVVAAGSVMYADLRGGQQGVMLKKLSPVFRKNNYWNSFFATGQVEAYPELVWQFIVPILCWLKVRITFIPNAQFNFQVHPVPTVLLYPFGWSTCVSLRLTGPHSLQDVATFNQYIMATKSFQLDPPPQPSHAATFSAEDLFDHIADGVRTDAFGAIKTLDFGPKEPVVVTTVMAKHSGSPSLNGLDHNQEKILLRIVKPDGPPLKGTVEDYVYRLDPASDLKYLLMDDYGRFAWLEDRLQPVDRNYSHLRCYHNNIFNSLVHARHLYQLLTQAAKLKALSAPLTELCETAVENLSSPSQYYENASLREFLRGPAVADAKKKMQKFNPQPGPTH